MWDEPRSGDGRRRQRKKGGFATKKEAQAHLNAVLASLGNQTYVQPAKLTFGDYLSKQWLPGVHARESRRGSSASRVDTYLSPRLTHIPLQSLARADLRSMFADLSTQ